MAEIESVEKTIHNIRRNTRKKYSAEDKIRIVLGGLSAYRYRRMIATTGGLFNQLLTKKIHATSALGFELKVVLFVLACSINMLFTGQVAT